MKRCLLCVPLLGLAPAGFFLSEYFDGAGALPGGFGFLLSAGCMFILPWIVAGLYLVFPGIKLIIRIALFVCALVAQGVLLFTVVPPGATCETMGTAHRLRREFPPDQIRDCAGQLRRKYREGTLALRDMSKEDASYMFADSFLAVADSELPASLHGRFKRVLVQNNTSSDQQVVFELSPMTGILCDNRKRVREFFVYSMADGVHAYRYQRM